MEISRKEGKLTVMNNLHHSEELPGIVLKALPGSYSLVNLPADAPIPEWATKYRNPDGLISLTRSTYGFSIICLDEWVPDDAKQAHISGWRTLRVEAPRDWAMHGLYSRLTQPLADDAISIYIIGSYNADHILVRNQDFSRAVQILSRFCSIV